MAGLFTHWSGSVVARRMDTTLHSISDLRSSVSQKRGTGEWRIKAFPFGIAMILSPARAATLRKKNRDSQTGLRSLMKWWLAFNK